MSNAAFAAVVFGVMGAVGGGAYFAMGTDGLASFDYNTASAAEQTAYLERKAKSMKGAFKPNHISKTNEPKVSGNAIQLSYNTGMGSLACGTDIDCGVKQCKRYLGKDVAKYDISVKLLYTDNNGRRIDSQSLSKRSCETKIKRWDAGADARKAKRAKDHKEMCSDDYIGMKPMFGC